MALESSSEFTQQRILALIICLLFGSGLFLSPVPASLSQTVEKSHLKANKELLTQTLSKEAKDKIETKLKQESKVLAKRGWRAFAVFITVIISFILKPYPMGPMVLFGLVFLMATKTLPYKDALKGYGDSVVWLVVAAFFLAGGVIQTGFGRRIALLLVKYLGGTILGLGYAICGAELILGPVVPSNTARGGGILSPIVRSLSNALGSSPSENPKRAGEYLILVGAQANLITAAMFLTGMAANPLVSKAAKDVFHQDFGWGTWALGAIVPGLVGLLLLPLLIYVLAKPELKETKAAQEEARKELEKMANWSTGEKVMAGVFLLLLVLWSTAKVGLAHGLSSTIVAWIGVSILLLTQTQKWEDILNNVNAWDTLIWLGGLLTLATSLKTYGVVEWFASSAKVWVSGFDPVTVVLLLAIVYFYSMYCFSMFTAHISAMVGVFFALAPAGVSPLLMIALFAYFSNLCGCTTNYSTGPVVIYFGLRYVSPGKWFLVGFFVSLFHLVIWLGIGMLWWKFLGWW